MRLLFTFNAKSLARFGLVSGRRYSTEVFNGGTVCQRRPLQQGKFEGYGSQWPQEGFEDIKAYRREEMRTIALKCLHCGFD